MIKKRIAIVTGSLVTGGAEAMVAELATKLDKNYYDVKVICIYIPVNSPIENKLIEEKIDLVFLNKEDGIDLKTFYNLNKELKKFNPDIVHTHLSGAIYSYPLIILNRYQMVHTLHTTPEKEFSNLTQKLFKLIYKFNLATLVTVSPENQKKAIKHYNLKSENVQMVFNPVDIKRFKPIGNSIKREDKIIRFINVGRQDKNKNQKMIIKAFNQVNKLKANIELILIGDGEKNKELKKITEDYQLEEKIKFKGIIGNPEEFLRKSDIYIQSSNYEGLPLSILEAMAAGLPIISTNVGGIKDIVTDNGFMINSNDPNMLAEVMIKLIDNKEKRLEMSMNSQKNILKFDSKIMAKEYSKIYEQLMLKGKKL